MRVPQSMLRCVAFLANEENRGDGQIVKHPQATGFFVKVPSVRRPLDLAYMYLVTAQHVAHKLRFPFYVRMNTTDGGAHYHPTGRPGEPYARWWEHPTDKSVDVAVTPFAPSRKEFACDWLPDEMCVREDLFTTKDQFSVIEYIGVGDEVLVPGLFAKATGQRRNLAIAREGNIAMLPDERIEVEFEDGKIREIEAYLVEMHSLGGLSGSPVFVYDHRVTSPRQWWLLGLFSGRWDIPLATKEMPVVGDMLAEDVAAANDQANAGVSIVVPAKHIRDVLFHEELIEIRAQLDAEYGRGNLPTLEGIAQPS